MKNHTLLTPIFPLLLILALAAFSCKTKAPAASEKPAESSKVEAPTATEPKDTLVASPEPPKAPATDSATCRLVVKFISAGEGINGEARLSLERYQMKFSLENSLPMRPARIPKGREGEVDYCYPMIGFTLEKADEFIKGLREFLEGQPLVIIQENVRIKRPE